MNSKPTPTEYPGFDRYTSHKEVRAAEITEFLGPWWDDKAKTTGHRVRVKGDHFFTIPTEALRRYQPKIGDFVVIYRDGYVSVSPGSEFVDGYTLAEAQAAGGDGHGE